MSAQVEAEQDRAISCFAAKWDCQIVAVRLRQQKTADAAWKAQGLGRSSARVRKSTSGGIRLLCRVLWSSSTTSVPHTQEKSRRSLRFEDEEGAVRQSRRSLRAICPQIRSPTTRPNHAVAAPVTKRSARRADAYDTAAVVLWRPQRERSQPRPSSKPSRFHQARLVPPARATFSTLSSERRNCSARHVSRLLSEVGAASLFRKGSCWTARLSPPPPLP